MELPPGIARLCDDLAAATGIERIVLGGSRATGTATDTSDWDLGVHYRGRADLSPITDRGDLHPPGTWGPVMNGGAWLDVDGRRVDVLLRDLDVVDHWCTEATHGRYEVQHLLGYIAGIPTYSLAAELAHAVVLRGPSITGPPFTDALRINASRRWRIHRDFSLGYAAATADHGDQALTIANLVRACLEEAHALMAKRGRWTLNEKGMLANAGLVAAGDAARAGDVAATTALIAGPASRDDHLPS